MADILRNQSQKKQPHHHFYYYTLPPILILFFIFFLFILTNNNQSFPLFLSPSLYRDLFSNATQSKDASFGAEKGGEYDGNLERVSEDAKFETKGSENGESLQGGSGSRVNESRVVVVSEEFGDGVENNGSSRVTSSGNAGKSGGNLERVSKDAKFEPKRSENGENLQEGSGSRVNESRAVTISEQIGNGVENKGSSSVPSSGNGGKYGGNVERVSKDAKFDPKRVENVENLPISKGGNGNRANESRVVTISEEFNPDIVAEEFDVQNGENGANLPPSDRVSSNFELGSGKSVPSSVNGGKIVSFQKNENLGFRNGDGEVKIGCNLYMGKWVRDDLYPIYEPGSCPYVDEAFDCQMNGRPDSGYLKWRWKPDQCDLPRFNATDFLVRLRGKRLMLVGDSVNRNQFESMLCLLHRGLLNKTKMFEVHGYKITKGRGFYVFKFVDYNCTVEFVRSHFLAREGVRINGQGNSNPTLSMDKIDKSAGRWKKADILIFNTGHWWVHGKISRGKNYFREGDYVYPQFDPVEAFRRALKTWAKWVDKNVNPAKQMVFYRGYSSAHFRGGDWDSGGTCNGETEPILSGAFLENYPTKMKIVEEVIQEMKVPVTLLNITRLTNFRKDGHPSIYGRFRTSRPIKVSTRKQDCSHWCLPGVPDAWNELVYATLVFQQTAVGNV